MSWRSFAIGSELDHPPSLTRSPGLRRRQIISEPRRRLAHQTLCLFSTSFWCISSLNPAPLETWWRALTDASWVSEMLVATCQRTIDFPPFYTVTRYTCIDLLTPTLCLFSTSLGYLSHLGPAPLETWWWALADASWVSESVVSACWRNIDFLSFYPVARYSCLIAHILPRSQVLLFVCPHLPSACFQLLLNDSRKQLKWINAR